MRRVFYLSRFYFRYGILRQSFHHPKPFPKISKWKALWKTDTKVSSKGKKTIWAAALTPAAFIKLSEEDNGDGKTPEEHMLEASRAEIQKRVPENVHGVKRAWRKLYILTDEYIYEPIATGLRFLHLVVIFVPVIISTPIIWLGRRLKARHNERSGTIWWYMFLVHSMERAGPAFIKVLREGHYQRIKLANICI